LPELKRCPCCPATHGRRARACCDWCERKIRSRRSTATAGHTRTRRRILDEIHRRELHRAQWRDVAMGRDAQLVLHAIFGAAPC
jgi:hypothetical protein